MTEFRFAANKLTDKRRDLPIHIALWGMVAGLVAIAAFTMYGPRGLLRELSLALAVLSGLIVASAIILAYVLAFRHASEKLRLESTFVLTIDSLIYKRTGRPDVQIALSEISALYSQNRRLVVESASLGRRIVIPQDLKGFNVLYESLEKYQHVTTRASYSVFRFASLLVYATCCAMVLWSKLFIVMILGSVIGLALIGVESFRLYTYIRHNPERRYPFIALICLQWLGAALVVYFRLVRS